jgi:hypothetical protein
MPTPRPARSSGIDLRTALILLAAFLTAVLTGLLTYAALRDWAFAVLAGGAAIAGTARFLDWLLARD